MYACSATHLGPMARFVFRFIRFSVDGEKLENDSKTIVWMENILSVFGAKTPFIRLSVWWGLVKPVAIGTVFTAWFVIECCKSVINQSPRGGSRKTGFTMCL